MKIDGWIRLAVLSVAMTGGAALADELNQWRPAVGMASPGAPVAVVVPAGQDDPRFRPVRKERFVSPPRPPLPSYPGRPFVSVQGQYMAPSTPAPGFVKQYAWRPAEPMLASQPSRSTYEANRRSAAYAAVPPHFAMPPVPPHFAMPPVPFTPPFGYPPAPVVGFMPPPPPPMPFPPAPGGGYGPYPGAPYAGVSGIGMRAPAFPGAYPSWGAPAYPGMTSAGYPAPVSAWAPRGYGMRSGGTPAYGYRRYGGEATPRYGMDPNTSLAGLY